MVEPALPNLSTQQLEYLVEVAAGPTWADAAARLGVSPSAVSQGLAQLERRIGVSLFDHHGRRRVLRTAAIPVLDHARRVLADTRDLARWAASMEAGRTGTVRVGMIDLAAIMLFGSTLQRFRRRRPDVTLSLAVAPSAELSDQLVAGELELAVVVEPLVKTGQLHYEPLVADELAIYAPDGRRAGDPSTWGPWVTFPASSHTRSLVAAALAELGAPFEVLAESHQPEVLRGMVALGIGWTVLPVLQAETEPTPLARARAQPLLTRRLALARRSGALVTTPAAEALGRELRSAAGH
jgi:DNA-binding transcriptional LysR family regulator